MTKDTNQYDPALVAIYNQLVVDLRSYIEWKCGTLADFVVAAKEKGFAFDVNNLYQSLAPKGRSRLSLSLYIRICQALEIGAPHHVPEALPPTSFSLLDYLHLNTDPVLKTLLMLQYQGA